MGLLLVAKRGALFLPTPSARRATPFQLALPIPLLISTHALREEGDILVVVRRAHVQAISTHALREEGDPVAGIDVHRLAISTHALREEGDPQADGADHRPAISTHALREEGDPPRSSFPVVL